MQKKGKYKTEIIVVTGSFYIMTDVRKSLALRLDDDYDLIQYQKYIKGLVSQSFH